MIIIGINDLLLYETALALVGRPDRVAKLGSIPTVDDGLAYVLPLASLGLAPQNIPIYTVIPDYDDVFDRCFCVPIMDLVFNTYESALKYRQFVISELQSLGLPVKLSLYSNYRFDLNSVSQSRSGALSAVPQEFVDAFITSHSNTFLY